MKFTLSTKPFADALDLGVIPGNISKYFKVSCLAQLTATQRELRINLQASNISTELLLRGSGDEEGPVTAFVDCLALKQIVGTFEANTTEIEFAEGGVILHSGSDKCTLAHLAESDDGELTRPSLPAADAQSIPIDTADWKFIKDYQMHAIALSFVHPIYMNVWLGESGDVIVGDFDNSLFTFSKKNKLGRTCLLTDTIINLINSLPSGAEIMQIDKSYRVEVKTDSFEYATEFTPKYEDEDGVGNYRADVILGTVNKDTDNSFKVSGTPLAKFLRQASILASHGDNKVVLELKDGTLEVRDDNVNTRISVEGNCDNFTVPVNSSLFEPVIGHLDSETINMCPILSEQGSPEGLVIWTDHLTVVLGAMDEE